MPFHANKDIKRRNAIDKGDSPLLAMAPINGVDDNGNLGIFL
jgi:hypothetical protein